MKAEVVLENGETARCMIFENLPEGTTVELEQNDKGYWNVVSRKQAAANAQHDEIMKYLKAILAAVRASGAQTVSTTTLPPKTTVAPSTKPTALDEVVPYNDGSDIDLDSIPF
jgi:hypothetical protein